MERERGNALFIGESRCTFLVESDIVGGAELVEVVDGGLQISSVAEDGVSEAGHSRSGGDIGEDLDEAERCAIGESSLHFDLEELIDVNRGRRLFHELKILSLHGYRHS